MTDRKDAGEAFLLRYGHLIEFHQGGCWIWTGQKDRKGYGKASTGGHTYEMAHRTSWQAFRGPLDPVLTLDHDRAPRCGHRACINPQHLEPMDRGDNARLSSHPNHVAHRSGQCTKGHEMTPANTYVSPGTGERQCRTCRKARYQARKDRSAGKIMDQSEE